MRKHPVLSPKTIHMLFHCMIVIIGALSAYIIDGPFMTSSSVLSPNIIVGLGPDTSSKPSLRIISVLSPHII